MQKARYEFISKASFMLPNGGQVFVVNNPYECNDFRHLLEQDVTINENQYRVKGVEIKTHAPPWREGENIGLLVK